MKTPKALKLKLRGSSRPEILQFKCNSNEKDYYTGALDKLNKISILKVFKPRCIQPIANIKCDIPSNENAFFITMNITSLFFQLFFYDIKI